MGKVASTAKNAVVEDPEAFEDALARLEEIVHDLETGELTLEDAFARFEEGVRLAKSCRSRLDGMEARVGELLENGDVRTIVPDDADGE